jgi:uncharacterized tellurite resistance protein B-like protein
LPIGNIRRQAAWIASADPQTIYYPDIALDIGPGRLGYERIHVLDRERLMLDGLRQFIADVVSPAGHEGRTFDDTGYRLAATALLIHVISIDGEPSEAEKRKLHGLIESRFGLDRGTADHLIASATLVEGEAVDLYHFTSVIMRSVNEEGRLRIVEMMWELVYADGQVTEFEDNVVWRAADLLGVSSRDRIELKHRVAAGKRAADGPWGSAESAS